MLKDKWIKSYFAECDIAAARSKDLSTKVGAMVIKDNKLTILSAYNGFPMGLNDDPNEVPERYEKPEKYLWTIHAEENLVAIAARYGIALNGTTIFVNLQPCLECTNLMIQAGIKAIYYQIDTGSGDWRVHLPKARRACIETQVEMHGYTKGLPNMCGIHLMFYRNYWYEYTESENSTSVIFEGCEGQFWNDSCVNNDATTVAIKFAKDSIDNLIKYPNDGPSYIPKHIGSNKSDDCVEQGLFDDSVLMVL